MHNNLQELLILAHNIHSGGGALLLNKFISSKNLNNFSKIKLIVDERFDLPGINKKNVTINKIKPSIISRFISELRIAKFRGTVLAFGNLPPLFTNSDKTIVFLHNALYFYPKIMAMFPFRVRIRLYIERVVLIIKRRSVSKFLVQTPHMRNLLIKNQIADSKKILVAPFADLAPFRTTNHENGSFICVSSGDPHKNIRNLILAWKIMGEEGIYPKLYLTVSDTRYQSLVEWINQTTKENNLFVINLGIISPLEISNIYESGSSLIFPSLCESLGLPLIEASYCGVAILAPELDYVRDVIFPAQTFDPDSPVSIARAVKRHLNLSEVITPLFDIEELTNKLF